MFDGKDCKAVLYLKDSIGKAVGPGLRMVLMSGWSRCFWGSGMDSLLYTPYCSCRLQANGLVSTLQ